MKDFLSTWWKASFFNFIEECKIVRYYKNLAFLRADFLLHFYKNPYKISKRYLFLRRQKNIYQYGETPLTTLESITKECAITKNDTVYELGAGRGRAALWLRLYLGATVVAIEEIPSFILHAKEVTKKVDRLTWICEDFKETEFKNATVIYLFGTLLTDQDIEQLNLKFKKLPSGVKLITISYPIEGIPLIKSFPARFTWGDAEVFLHLT